MVVAMDMNTTTENISCDTTAIPNPMDATMIPTSPRGIIPIPMMVDVFLPILQEPIPQPTILVITARAVPIKATCQCI